MRIEKISKNYADRAVLNNVSYLFPQGERIALIGANGAGKTTLLNILCKIIEPDDGMIHMPKGYVIGYLPQEPNPDPQDTVLAEMLSGAVVVNNLKADLDKATALMSSDYSEENYTLFEKAHHAFEEAGGYAIESQAKGLLSGLGFANEQFGNHPSSLSGGWRMRLELGKVLLNNPDFLVLDEPTNHLDLPSLVWLEGFLKSFKGTMLFVSHDKDLLNSLATYILHLACGELNAYKGNFDQFLIQRESVLNEQAAKSLSIRRKISDMQKFVDRFGAKSSKARQAQSRVKMIARLKELDTEGENYDEEISINLASRVQGGKTVVNIEDLDIGYDSTILHGINFRITKGQKIAVIGANGLGKSTFLKTVVGMIQPRKGEIIKGHNLDMGYFAQDHLNEFDAQLTVLENVTSQTGCTEREARKWLGNLLIKGDSVFKKFVVLSGGEKSRVSLCCILLQGPNFLLLDEPTNHLDMSSTEILIAALQEYTGTVLFISHNRSFINSLATHVFVIADKKKFALFDGNLESYERRAKAIGFPVCM